MLTHGIQTWDSAGRATIGYDNPCVLIDIFDGPLGSSSPPIVYQNSFDYKEGTKAYTLSAEAARIAVVALPLPIPDGYGAGPVRYLVYEVY